MRGMTWDHPRGVDPLLAASREWQARTGQEIDWDRRSLQDFETFPVEELARQYDLIVIDHPHVGQVADAGCLVPLETICDTTALAEIEAGSVGLSYASYHWKGHQWALPIDAAAQVQAWVPGRLPAPLHRWDDVLALTRKGALALPLRPPHSLMSLFTLCGLDSVALDVDGPDLFPAEARIAYDRLLQLADLVDPISYEQDPIAILDAMSSPDSSIAASPFIYGYASYALEGFRPVRIAGIAVDEGRCRDGGIGASPFIYGYVSYALEGFRPVRISFADLPVTGSAGPSGSALGGTGLAISSSSEAKAEAAAFAQWVAGGAVQTNLYAPSGGQPGHAHAWADAALNEQAADFYKSTMPTLTQSWLRPRHTGYMAFQQQASDRLNEALRSREDADQAIAALNRLFRASF